MPVVYFTLKFGGIITPKNKELKTINQNWVELKGI